MRRRFTAATLEPMYATIGTDVPPNGEWSFEPKYDGMRALAFVSPTRVQLMTRNGKDKSAQFPEVTRALGKLGRQLARRVVLDGEVVALERNRPGHFQSLQGRFHLKSAADIAHAARVSPAAIFLFDILADDREALVDVPLTERRAWLERVLRRAPAGVRISESSPNGTRMLTRAQRGRWEGVIAKRSASLYVPGARSRDWLKLKLQHRAEFVIAGFTEPRRTRPFLGAILLGYFDASDHLRYVGHTGGGFDRESLRDLRKRLERIEQDESPFTVTPRSNERVHWVKPRVVVEVKFAEWTSDQRLRQPIFLGIRDDKNARDVHLERDSIQRLAGRSTRKEARGRKSTSRVVRRAAPRQARATAKRAAKRRSKPSALVAQIEQLQRAGGEGALKLAARKTLHVSSLDKVFFEDSGVTKGDLMRYYALVAPVLLPLLEDRPLILKRYPNGIGGSSFFQQNAGENPPGVRVADVAAEDGKRAKRIIGGDLLTLLHTVQLGTIAVHPWQSRLPMIEFADYSTIDLDPGKGVPFARVVELAERIRDELEKLELKSAVKTSGSRGLHIVLPLPTRTSYARSAALADAVAARVAANNPTLATLERSLQRRPKGTIYVDAKQNARGKSVASAYSVRERPGAPVSAPLRWNDLNRNLRIEDFTIATMPDRLDAEGDLWGEALKRRNTARAIDRALKSES
ncbi:MAG TPA: DNA ligase D [Gemmatimonadaceae bacterium]|jgi:bifunctional non-homologous end joining protein LigD